MVTIGEKIKELRKQKKLTQEDLAKLLGLNRTTISKWERQGGSEPDIATIKKLADIFGVTTDYLLGHADNPTKQRDLPQTVAPHALDGFDELSPAAKEEVLSYLDYIKVKYGKKEGKNNS